MTDLQWLRSRPATVPDGRNYVVDRIPRAVMDGNYLTVFQSLSTDTVLVE
jgi:hypothetical protein